MTISRSEHSGFPELIRPEHRLRLTAAFALRFGQYGCIGPDLLDDIEFVFGRFVAVREPLHDWVVFRDDVDRIVALMFVVFAGDTQELAPIIDFGFAVRMHRTMNHNRIGSSTVRLRDAANVGGVVGIGEALVVNYHVETVGPLGSL